MQLKERDGIACDYCGMTYRHDFEYFSFDFHMVSVYNNIRPPLNSMLRSNIVFSVDICPTCFASISNRVIENYSKLMSPNRRVNNLVQCDWTQEKLSGTYNLYYCVITKVIVKMVGQPNVCISCKTKTFDYDKACSKCGGNNFTRPAAIDSQDRFLELTLSENAYKHFVDKSQSIKQIAGEWSTKS